MRAKATKPREGLDEFSRFSVTNVGNHPRYFGHDKRDKKTRIAEVDFEKGFIQDSLDFEVGQRHEAIWHTEESDVPVTITGIYGSVEEGDKEVLYYEVKGSDAGIPESEIEWLQSDEQTETSELQPLEERIQKLETVVASLMAERTRDKARIAQLENLLDERGIVVPPHPEIDETSDQAIVSEELEESEKQGLWGTAKDKYNAARVGVATTMIALRHKDRVEQGDNPDEPVDEKGRTHRVLWGLGGVAVGAGLMYLFMRTGNSGIDNDQYNALALDIDSISSKHNHLLAIVDPNGVEQPGNAFTDLKNQMDTSVQNIVAEIGEHAAKSSDEHAKLALQHANIQEHIDGAKNTVLDQINATTSLDTGSSGAGSEYLGGYSTQELSYGGDTIWSHVEESLKSELGYQPSNLQIHSATQRVLDANNLSWADARHLRIGYDFKVPKNLIS